MVYIKRWTDFETQATELYTKSPLRVRYCVKFRPKTGQLVLKLTDDLTCIKYKSHSSIVLNRFEALNTRLLFQMGNVRRPLATVAATIAGDERAGRAGTPAATGKGGDGDVVMHPAHGQAERGGTPAPESGKGGPGTPGGAGGGKKKKKKGKK